MPRLIQNEQSKYFSRELSWLSFNERVLEEASDTSNPLLERLKFLGIVSSNLEEFFRVRVAALFRKEIELSARKSPKKFLRDGFELKALLKSIRSRVYDQKHRQAIIYEQLVRELAHAGLIIEQKTTSEALRIFESHVLQQIYPLRVLPDQQTPPLKGGRIHFLADHPQSFSIIEMPHDLPRFFTGKDKKVYLTDQLIFNFKELIFKSNEVREIFSFKISRDAEIDLSDDSEDYVEEIEEALKHRDLGKIVRLEVDSVSPSSAVNWLAKKLDVAEDRLYQVSLPLDLKSLAAIHELRKGKVFRFYYPKARKAQVFKAIKNSNDFFSILKKQDQLLHHPYCSFDPVADLVKFAAHDPHVTRICQTLYRTSGKSAVLNALLEAAKNGKKVLALVEVKARFDEANNLKWARALENAGARVIYGTPDIKIHAKLTLVERRPPEKKKQLFVHVGTGNYHPITAKFYTDLGILSASKEYGQQAKKLFDLFEKMDDKDDYSQLSDNDAFSQNFSTWAVAPAKLQKQIIEWIDNETANAQNGLPAFVRAKMNGLVEKGVIQSLYRASQAGVKIDLLIRGMCCLRPGVKKLSENIRVYSIIDKYLEHSRFFIFANGGQAKAWISSADWMPRNLFRRIELAVPVVDPKITRYMNEVLWPQYISDNTKLRECLGDGRYVRNFDSLASPHQAQIYFESAPVPNFEI